MDNNYHLGHWGCLYLRKLYIGDKHQELLAQNPMPQFAHENKVYPVKQETPLLQNKEFSVISDY